MQQILDRYSSLPDPRVKLSLERLPTWNPSTQDHRVDTPGKATPHKDSRGAFAKCGGGSVQQGSPSPFIAT